MDRMKRRLSSIAMECDETPSRKRVRFEVDEKTNDVKRRVIETNMPSSSELSEEEKSKLWTQLSDHKRTAKSVQQIVDACRTIDSKPDDFRSFTQYAQFMTQTYVQCCCSEDEKHEFPKADHLAILGAHHCDVRGLESRVLPEIASDRLQRRQVCIQSILQLQLELKFADDTENITDYLRIMSEHQSRISQRFAREMGVLDERAALLVYVCDDAAQKPSLAETQLQPRTQQIVPPSA